MDAIAIVGATAEHAPALTTLMHRSSAYHGQYAGMLAGYVVTADYLGTHPTFLAVTDTDLLGFYSLIVRPPELDLLFVVDEAQGRGIGALLVAHLLDEARRRGMDALRVVSNPPAEGFYLRQGARRVGTVPPRPPRVTWTQPELVFDL